MAYVTKFEYLYDIYFLDDHQSVWQIADQIEENETTQDFHFTEELLYHAPQVTKVLQNLAWLYRHQGKVKAAKFIEQQTTITSLGTKKVTIYFENCKKHHV